MKSFLNPFPEFQEKYGERYVEFLEDCLVHAAIESLNPVGYDTGVLERVCEYLSSVDERCDDV